MDLGDRMKGYENVSRIYLSKRLPAILRLDGKSFHSFTKGMEKPWDGHLTHSMLYATIALCEKVEGVKLAYWQSDEASLLLTDYDNLNTQAWFDKNIQKIVSVSASIMTAEFNNFFRSKEKYKDYPLAYFDSRVFVLPKEEVCNYFIWRQQDATRNSVQGLAQSHFSHKQLHKLNTGQLQDKLMVEKNINWNDCLTWQKRGACTVKEKYMKDDAERSRWIVDWEIPIFTQDRNYIEKYL